MEVRRDDDGSFKIRNVRVDSRQGINEAHWDYVRADYFLLVIEAIDKYHENEEDWLADILRDAGTLVQRGQDARGDLSLFWLSEGAYHYSKQTFRINLKQEVQEALKVRVFPAVKKDGEKDYIVYCIEQGEENTGYIPINVLVKVKSQTKLFSGVTKCTMHLPAIRGYAAGALCYKPSHLSCEIPISEEITGKEVEIELPKNESIKVAASSGYEYLYRVRMSEEQ